MAELTAGGVPVYRDSAGVLREVPPGAQSNSGDSTAPAANGTDLLYHQLSSAQLQTVQRLSPPPGAVTAHVQSNGGSAVRYRGDGVDPSPAIGMILEPGDGRDFSGDLTRVAFIDQGGNAVLDVTYYD